MGYWEERQEDMYKAGEMKVNQYFSRLEKAFNQTRRELRKTVESFYFRYAEENGLSYAAAQKKLDAEELGELKDYIDLVMQNIGKYNQTVNNLSIKARITRYQALEAQIDAMLRQLYAIDYQSEAEKTMQEVYEDTYYRTWYNADQYHGFHAEFAQVSPTVVEKLLEYPFNGVAFSSRLWKQKDHLQAQLMEAVTTMLIQGKHPSTLTKEFAKKMQSKKFDAYRLLHTESSFLMSEAAHAGYKEDGVEKYEILATLDSKTCGVCGELDGKLYEIGKEVVGVNMPPFHPLCRCTDVPYYDDTPTEDLTRVARDPETGKIYEVPADMTWKEWKKKYVKDNQKIFSSISMERGRYNEEAEFKIPISNVSKEILETISNACKDVIRLGAKDGKEHGFTINILSGEKQYYTSGTAGEVFGKEFFEYLQKQPENSVISIHNHADNRGFSYTDINTFVSEKALYGNIAACHNGKAYYVEQKVKDFETGSAFTDADLFDDIVSALRSEMKNGNIEMYQFSSMKEERCCERIAQTYFRKYEVIE